LEKRTRLFPNFGDDLAREKKSFCKKIKIHPKMRPRLVEPKYV